MAKIGLKMRVQHRLRSYHGVGSRVYFGLLVLGISLNASTFRRPRSFM